MGIGSEGKQMKLSQILLFSFSAITFLIGVVAFKVAKSAIHEIEGLILFNAAAVFLTGAFIVASGKRK